MSQHPLFSSRALRTAGIAIGAGAIIASALPAQAATADSSASARVDAYMAAFPYGTKVSNNEISWENGEVGVVLSATAASCPNGYYCVYEHQYYRGAMAKWRASRDRCKKFNFTPYWRDKVSSFWARGTCPDNNYFLKDKKAFQPDPFQAFEGKRPLLSSLNDRIDYAARGYTD
ncbi:peptidase inhibitor family I36 protein [Nonomuraea sp. NPDC002799]